MFLFLFSLAPWPKALKDTWSPLVLMGLFVLAVGFRIPEIQVNDCNCVVSFFFFMMLLFSLKMKSDYKRYVLWVTFLLLNLIFDTYSACTILTIVYAVPFRYLGMLKDGAVLLVVTWFWKSDSIWNILKNIKVYMIICIGRNLGRNYLRIRPGLL